jgi:hypothetical protein
VEQHFPPQRTPCRLCGKVLKNGSSLTSHMNFIHRKYKKGVKTASAAAAASAT